MIDEDGNHVQLSPTAETWTLNGGESPAYAQAAILALWDLRDEEIETALSTLDEED